MIDRNKYIVNELINLLKNPKCDKNDKIFIHKLIMKFKLKSE